MLERGGPTAMTGVLTGGTFGHRRASDDRGGGGDAATSQGRLEPPKAQRGGKDPPIVPPAHTWILDLCSPGPGEDFCKAVQFVVPVTAATGGR